MLLAHPKKNNPKKWEVATMWLPYFLAMDQKLLAHLDETLTKECKEIGYSEEMIHDRIIDLILERYPISGLREYLYSVTGVNPEKSV